MTASPKETGVAPTIASMRRMAAGVWDRLFGPPPVRALPDGSVSVRLLGRRFEASSRGALFDAVSQERVRLLEQIARLHEGAALRPFAGTARIGDGYHRDTQRLEDRVSLYTEFLGRLAKDLEE